MLKPAALRGVPGPVALLVKVIPRQKAELAIQESDLVLNAGFKQR